MLIVLVYSTNKAPKWAKAITPGEALGMMMNYK